MLSRARALWRSGRTWPVLRDVISAADRVWWSRVIRRADIVDLDFVAAQTGSGLTARGAIRRYVRGGFRSGFSLNPLFVERTVSRQLSDADRVPALYAYLVNDRERLEVSPNWNAPGYVRRVPGALEDAAGPLGHAWRAALRRGSVDLGTGEMTVPVPWHAFRELTLRAAAEGRAPAASAEHRSVATRTSGTLAVWAVDDDERDADEALRTAVETAGQLAAELVVCTRRPPADVWVQASLATLWVPGLVVQRDDVPLASAATAVAATATMGVVLVRGPHADLPVADAVALARAGSTRPTAPLWLAPDGTVAAAGVVIARGRRSHLLAGNPAEDARALGGSIDVVELAGVTRAYPAAGSGSPQTLLTTTVIAPDALADPAPVALPDTDVDALLSPAHLRVSGYREPGNQAVFTRVTTASTPVAASPSLRWAIKIASPAGSTGESWGDTHFARGLAHALRRLGQDVVIDAHPAHHRVSTYLDDVVLALRGPKRIDPPAAAHTLLWIISHPDEISPSEVAAFDRVFAASVPWARSSAARWGARIEPLLQCTDTAIFRPSGAARGADIVFVGTARGIARPVVVEPLRAGVPVRVYGPDWRGYIPASAIAATGIANARLGRLYESAAVVLNDHWPAMKEHGFISNRPYDVVAAGGRVISDRVEGMHDVFGGAVATYDDGQELVRMLTGDLDAVFPADDELEQISRRIRDQDSFDARAATLLEAVLSRR